MYGSSYGMGGSTYGRPGYGGGMFGGGGGMLGRYCMYCWWLSAQSVSLKPQACGGERLQALNTVGGGPLPVFRMPKKICRAIYAQWLLHPFVLCSGMYGGGSYGSGMYGSSYGGGGGMLGGGYGGGYGMGGNMLGAGSMAPYGQQGACWHPEQASAAVRMSTVVTDDWNRQNMWMWPCLEASPSRGSNASGLCARLHVSTRP
jgi:hypothetical protein